jgi:hypothetical protein
MDDAPVDRSIRDENRCPQEDRNINEDGSSRQRRETDQPSYTGLSNLPILRLLLAVAATGLAKLAALKSWAICFTYFFKAPLPSFPGLTCNASKGTKDVEAWLESSKYCQRKGITASTVAEVVKGTCGADVTCPLRGYPSVFPHGYFAKMTYPFSNAHLVA